jgi:3-deoxy-D-manno-octulosonic-acid transferase
MQSEADAERMRALGMDETRLEISGNVKFDLLEAGDEHALTESLSERFGLNQTGQLIVAASTHRTEERICIAAFKQLRATAAGHQARLLIAPRHPERFDEVATLLDSSGLRWARRSASPRDEDKTCDMILLDSIGELRAIYPLAAIVFVGGSLAPVGGHNVLEPAASGAPVITGAHTGNFAAIVAAFLERDALVQLPPLYEGEAASELSNTFEGLLSDDLRRRKMIGRGKEVLAENRGATLYTANRVAQLLSEESDS